jgi:hypothetical protein
MDVCDSPEPLFATNSISRFGKKKENGMSKTESFTTKKSE